MFDWGKAGPSTKGSKHHRPAGCEGRKVMLNLSMTFRFKMDAFLYSKDNKQRFLGVLGEHLATRGCEIAYSIGSESLRNM